jgi:hypothetical protein
LATRSLKETTEKLTKGDQVDREKLQENLLRICKTHFPEITLCQSLVARLLDLIEATVETATDDAVSEAYSEGYDSALSQVESNADYANQGGYDEGYQVGYEDGHQDGLDDRDFEDESY